MKFVLRLLSLLTVVAVTSPAFAQQGRFGVFQQNMSRFIPPPRSINQRLKDAQEAIADKRFSDAVVTLGDLLENNDAGAEDGTLVGQDFFLEIADNDQQRLDKTFLRHCRDLVGSLPSEARETYELRYGALARQLLDKATETRDWNRLRDVRRKYFHTQAGYYASLILAQREIDLGHPLAASLLLDDVVTSPHAIAELGQQVRVMHAVASRLAGRPLPKDLDTIDATIRVGKERDSHEVSDWRGWIDDHYTFSQTDTISRSADYLLMGGDPSRNETMDGQLPLSTPRWMVETTATPLEDQQLRQKSDELAASGRLVPPSWTPIRVGGQLLMRTTDRLQGVDYRTGKRVWQHPWYQTDVSEPSEETLSIQGLAVDEAEDRLGRQVWNDFPYGQITSDGQRVFVLDDLSPIQVLRMTPLMGIRNTQSVDGSRNTLVALELATEGKTLWRLGQNPTVESELNEAFFLGAPIAVDGSLYGMVELAGDIILVCLDPATGQLRWQQQLVALEGIGIQYDAIRRISGATPSYHDGVLICPTGAGATIAIDLADRTLRWGNSYQRRSYGNSMATFSRSRQSDDELSQRWHNSAAITSGLAVLVTPVATDNLFCFDLVDGKKRFSKPRQAAFYVAGIRDGLLLMVSAREVVGYDMENGRLSWRSDQRLLPPGQQIVGRGVFGPGYFIVPTSGNELVKIALTDGTLLERRTTRYPLGNLIAIDGEIISQSPTKLAVAMGTRTLGPRVERMLAEDPDNLDALIQKALLLSEQGNRQEALEVLSRARAIDPDSDDVLVLSIASMLGVLREDPSPPPGLEQELDALIDTPAQRLEFLALRIQSALRNESVKDATERLLEFTSVMVDVTLLGTEDETILRDPSRDCSLNSWASARAAEIMQMATQQDQLPLVQQILQSHLESKRLGATRLLRSLAQQLSPLGVDDLVVSLAQRELAEDEFIAAERLLLGPLRTSSVLNQSALQLSPARTEMLAQVYANGMLGPDALRLVDTLRGASETAPDDVSDQTQTAQLDAIAELADRSIEPGAAPLDLDANVTLNWVSQALPGTARSAISQRVVEPTLEGGNSFDGWAVINSNESVAMRQPLGGTLRLPLDEFPSRSSSDRKASVSGGVMILERPGRVSAIDLFAMRSNLGAEALMWSRDFGSDGATVTTRKGHTTAFGDTRFSYPTNSSAANVMGEFRVGPILGDRLIVLQSGDLLAIDLTNNETMWRNSSAPPLGSMVADRGRVAVVSYRSGIVSEVNTFDLLDGRKIESMPWDYGTVWTTSGKHVLAYQETDNGSSAIVRLVDPLAQQDDQRVVLEIESLISQPRIGNVGRAMGRILQDRYLVLMDTGGRLVIWDLLHGTELCRHETGAMPELESMNAMWMDGQIVVLPANPPATGRDKLLVQHGDVHRPCHKLIAVSTDSGQINWERDFETPWGVTITQPAGSPVLILARSKTTYTVRSPTPYMDVALIRMTDGKTIHEELEHEVAPRSAGLTTIQVAQPALGRVLARIDGEVLTYEFGGEPVTQP
ncbi:PQQ-binding-like beta-propeller repeat protein [Stieleria sp. TO1_6]|uniref:outer membrane protein assembly factor BamB family protein n=1 Tax=Stieleria tagensis TaxID=2956795 RepID=UPI00209AD937|nr:PQQ-binding-like beta-propeller repeat protein [Stieleria tagensis]MCO8120232.1 PQQ-binding-like beta-propeller repeat protein [Stieleria tagensis]